MEGKQVEIIPDIANPIAQPQEIVPQQILQQAQEIKDTGSAETPPLIGESIRDSDNTQRLPRKGVRSGDVVIKRAEVPENPESQLEVSAANIVQEFFKQSKRVERARKIRI